MSDDNAADSADQRITLRGVTRDYQTRLKAAAARADISQGAWICEAIDLKLEREREPVEIVAAEPAAKSADAADLATIRDLVELAAAFATADGKPMRQDVRKLGYDLIAERLAALAGVPVPAKPVPPRRVAMGAGPPLELPEPDAEPKEPPASVLA